MKTILKLLFSFTGICLLGFTALILFGANTKQIRPSDYIGSFDT